MTNFNEDYKVPESAPNPLEKSDEAKEVLGDEKTTEQIQAEIKEAELFFENIDTLSNKNSYLGETQYVEKLKQIDAGLTGTPEQKEEYVKTIKNLLDSHTNALSILNEKNMNRKPSELPTTDQILDKSDEVSERKAVLERHLYDLKMSSLAQKY